MFLLFLLSVSRTILRLPNHLGPQSSSFNIVAKAYGRPFSKAIASAPVAKPVPEDGNHPWFSRKISYKNRPSSTGSVVTITRCILVSVIISCGISCVKTKGGFPSSGTGLATGPEAMALLNGRPSRLC